MQKSVSVVVVSEGQPDRLCTCVTALSQQKYANFEVIVVADRAGIDAAARLPFSDHIKLVDFNRLNTAAARNLGISYAAGEFVAFTHAVPDPSWLEVLMAPAEHGLSVMTGAVHRRKGTKRSGSAHVLDMCGDRCKLQVEPNETTVIAPATGRAIAFDGLNFAVRRSVLVALEGFDAGFQAPHSEVDLSMRLAKAGYKTAIVPNAVVHDAVKIALRSHKDLAEGLFETGANCAMFHRKHVHPEKQASHRDKVKRSQSADVMRHFVEGVLEPRDVGPVLAMFEAGYQEGQIRPINVLGVAPKPALPFAAYPTAD